MKRTTLFFAFAILTVILLLASCVNKSKFDLSTDEQQKGEFETSFDQDEKDEIVTVNYTIKYYDIIEDKVSEHSDVAKFNNEVDPRYFINKLSELMQIRIDVNSVVIYDNKMSIDFSSDSAPLNGTGAYEESCILDSISATMLSVFENVDYIHFTEDGKDYESGHISLSKDTPYAQR